VSASNSASTITPAYLNTDEAAVYLGVTNGYLRTMRSCGEGPAYSKLSDARNARIRYATADLDAWVAARRVGGAA
jgi:hypothetical protein